MGFSDAKLLFYPIKSIHNLFSYVSCPYLINRFIEDLQMIIKDGSEEKNNLQSNNKEGINLDLNNLSKIDPNSIVEGKAIFTDEEKDELILDVFSFTNKKNHEYDELLEFLHNEFKLHRDLVILSDEDFIELISLNREIVTRNRIGDDGITKEGGLFTEEYLPAESILYTLLLVNGIINDTQNLIKKYKSDFPRILQIGGDSTIGKGIVKVKICNPSNGGIKNE
ncbi:MAG: type III-B CRISPR module RAMP protein Cmr4 [Firmicutes bacterium]|nr:type III-B CRISPR module RAMP protein Cmr4 [Bacillota bacterium]